MMDMKYLTQEASEELQVYQRFECGKKQMENIKDMYKTCQHCHAFANTLDEQTFEI